MSTLILRAPPHLDHWTSALVWILTEVEHHLGQEAWSAAAPCRAIIRLHPMYERFIAANAVTEGELTELLLGRAKGTVIARKDLESLPELDVAIFGLSDLQVRADLFSHGGALLPPHFTLKAQGQPPRPSSTERTT